MVYGRTMWTSVCVSTSKDVLTSWLRIPDRDEIRERTHQRPYGSARNVFQGQESSRVPRVVYSILDQVNIGTIPTTPCP
jgi:hypothetical protein